MVTATPSENEIGSRVSIRLHEPEGGFRDVLGVLESLTTVRKKDGSVASFNPAAIALWKVVPPK